MEVWANEESLWKRPERHSREVVLPYPVERQGLSAGSEDANLPIQRQTDSITQGPEDLEKLPPSILVSGGFMDRPCAASDQTTVHGAAKKKGGTDLRATNTGLHKGQRESWAGGGGS